MNQSLFKQEQMKYYIKPSDLETGIIHRKRGNIINIGCLTHEYPPVGGGGSPTIHEINLRLFRMGYNINVLTTAFRNAPRKEIIGRIHIERLYSHRTEQATTSLDYIAIYALSSTYHALRYYNGNDIIHAYFVIPAGIPGYFMKKIRKKPLIVTIFGADIYDPTRFKLQRKIINSLATRRILRSADIVTTISHDLASRIREVYDTNVEIIHCGVDTVTFCPGNPEKTKKELGLDTIKTQILFVGRLVRRKSVDSLLLAMKEIIKEHEDVELNIIGQGPEREMLERIINKSNLQKHVSLVGFVDKKQLIKYYQDCDIFVMPSLHEGQGCAVLEAMSCGKPIVATNVGGIPDSVINNYNGILVPPNNPKELGKALLSLIGDDKLRLKLGANSRKRSVSKFDWSIIAKQINKIYSELV